MCFPEEQINTFAVQAKRWGNEFISKTICPGAPQPCLEERHGAEVRQEGQKTPEGQGDQWALLAGVGGIKGSDEEAGKWRGAGGEGDVLRGPRVGLLWTSCPWLPLVPLAAVVMGTMSQAASEAPLWAGLD